MRIRTLANIAPYTEYLRLPSALRREFRKDLRKPGTSDPGAETVIDLGVEWLFRAQDHSASGDGGVARHFELLRGWGSSYPETTGYIIPTLVDYAKAFEKQEAYDRARRMLDWLVSIQFPDGGFQGGTIGSRPRMPVTFNTGQILLGLAAGVRQFGNIYLDSMTRAADWLVKTQDRDGCWRKHSTPFAVEGEKSYETHVAWGLFEAARLEPGRGYGEAGLRNASWALTCQHEDGWFEKCCLTDPSKPLTHTLGYALRGLVEAYRFSPDDRLLAACVKTADALARMVREDGFLAGRFSRGFKPAAFWSCLTGSAQISCCWLILYEITGTERYRDAALKVNRFLRRTIDVRGSPDTRGALKGSFPVFGDYCRYQYPNWGTKFLIDAHMLELASANKHGGADEVHPGMTGSRQKESSVGKLLEGRQKYGCLRYTRRVLAKQTDKLFFRLDKHALVTAFHDVGIKGGDKVFVHASMNRMGYIEGGAETVIRALMEAVGPAGSIFMPTFSTTGSMEITWTAAPPSM